MSTALELSTAFEFDTTGQVATVALNDSLAERKSGEVDQAAKDLAEKIAGLDRAVVLMDLSRLKFMGSSIVALLVRAWKVIEERHGQMVVVSSHEMVTEVLKIAGLNRIWPVVESRDEAERILLQRPPVVPTRPGTFLLALLGWVAAAGAVGFVVILKREMTTFNAQTAQQMTIVCGGVAATIGLLTSLRETQVWKLLGVLLLLVSVSMIGIAVI